MNRVGLELLYTFCSSFSGPGYYMENEIKATKLARIRESLKIPANEPIVAFLDTTIFRTGRCGMAIAASGVYWRNGWFFRSHYRSWRDFNRVKLEIKGKYLIQIGKGNYFRTGIFDSGILIELLNSIKMSFAMSAPFLNQSVITSHRIITNQNISVTNDDLLRPAPPKPRKSNQWMVAVDGQQYGPYDQEILEEMVKSGQIIPENTFVWKEGMTAWVPFAEPKELAKITKKHAAPPPPAPSAPSEAAGPSGPDSQNVSHPAGNAPTHAASERETELVDINRASYEELVEILGLGAVDAKKIIQEREANGGFETPEQVGQLLGLKPHQVEKLRKQVRFDPLPGKPKNSNSRVVDY